MWAEIKCEEDEVMKRVHNSRTVEMSESSTFSTSCARVDMLHPKCEMLGSEN